MAKRRTKMEESPLFTMFEIVPSNGEMVFNVPKGRKGLLVLSTPEVVDELKLLVKDLVEEFGGEGEEYNKPVVSLDGSINLNRVALDGNQKN